MNPRYCLILLVLFTYDQAFSEACSIGPGETIHQHDESEFLLEGRITGYAKAEQVIRYPTGEARSETWGIQIVVSNITYPDMDLDTLEVYNFGLSAICSPLPRSLDLVKERYALGSYVAVVAKRGQMIDPLGEVPRRLEAKPFYRGIYPITQTGQQPGYTRLRALLFEVAQAKPDQLDRKIEHLALIAKFYARPERLKAPPTQLRAQDGPEGYPRDRLYTDELTCSMTLLRYLESRQELSLLEEKLKTHGIPRLPRYLEKKSSKLILLAQYRYHFPEHHENKPSILGIVDWKNDRYFIYRWIKKARSWWKKITPD